MVEKVTRLDKLRELERELREALSHANSRSMAALAKQYRETLAEIAYLEGEGGSDGIDELLDG